MRTADDKDGGTEAKVYIVLIGTQACTDKIDLELIQKNGFEPGTAETFSVEGIDVGEIRKIEVGERKYIVCFIVHYFYNPLRFFFMGGFFHGRFFFMGGLGVKPLNFSQRPSESV